MRITPIDAAAALGLTLAGQVEVWAPDLMVGAQHVDGSRPILSATTLATTAAIAVRRSRPVGVALVVAAATAIQGLSTTPTEGLTGVVALLLAAYAAAAYAERGSALAGLVALLLGVAAVSKDAADWVFAAVLACATWLAGAAVRRRAALARTNERAHIARDLHDIVSHRVTAMVVQAQAAAALVDADPAGARRSLAAIDESGRQALAELRDLLGVLRGSDALDRTPRPGLADLTRLVDDARTAGLPVHLRVEGEPFAVEPGLGLAAYRIAQEALTNVVRHAGAARTEVVLRYGDRELEVRVTDAGPGSGHGLLGMRERAAVYGGSVEAGATGEGFTVRASLPVRAR